MLLKEIQSLLKKTKITNEDLWDLNSIYLILDLEKEDFCKIIDLIGLEKLLEKTKTYERFYLAEKEFTAKEKYKKAKIRLTEIEEEKAIAEETVSEYKAYLERISQNDY